MSRESQFSIGFSHSGGWNTRETPDQDLYQAILQRFRLAESLARNEAEKRKLESLALMLNMVSHDVRKPFSILKVVLDGIRSSRTARELRALTEAALPELQTSIDSVEGLLQDVMQVGSGQAEHPEGYVEFEFTLPAGLAHDKLPRPLIAEHSSAYRMELGLTKDSDSITQSLWHEQLMAAFAKIRSGLQMGVTCEDNTHLVGVTGFDQLRVIS
jgi:hypothetical protein